MKISVFITSYNQKEYLVEAIDSVLAQTLKPHQIIIADDCSTDGSREVIEGYCSRYPDLITPVYHEKNTGVARVRIDALNAVTGDYVTYLDGDDRFLPEKLERESGALRNSPDARIAFSNNYYMTPDGRRTGVWVKSKKPPEGDIFKETFARDFPRRNIFRMELVDYGAWKKIGFHDPELRIYEDFDMRIRLTKALRAVYHDEPLSEIRMHGKGLSSTSSALHFDTLEYIFKKNSPLLDDLAEDDRRYVKEKYFEFFAVLERMSAVESLNQSRRIDAARHLFKAFRLKASLHDLALTARLLLPVKPAKPQGRED